MTLPNLPELCVYFGYSLLFIPLIINFCKAKIQVIGFVSHIIDLAIFSLFIYFTEGPSSPFFVYFVFLIFCSALRWRSTGILWTTILSLSVYMGLGLVMIWVLHEQDGETNRFIIRSTYLAIVGFLLSHLSSYEQNARRELAMIADWPQLAANIERQDTYGDSLRYAAAVMKTPQILMIWDEEEEPYRHSVYVDGDRVDYNKDAPDRFEPVVAEALQESDFLCSEILNHKPRVIRQPRPGASNGKARQSILKWRLILPSTVSSPYN